MCRAAQDCLAGLDGLIAVGAGGPLLVSSDGMTWTTQASPTDEELFAITFGSHGQWQVWRSSGLGGTPLVDEGAGNGLTMSRVP